MRRFDYENSEDDHKKEIDRLFNMDDYEDDDYEDDNEDSVEYDDLDLFHAAHMEMMGEKLDYNLLMAALDLCKQSFFWKFKKFDKKLILIAKAYTFLKRLLEEEIK